MRQAKTDALTCSFCHKSQDVVAKLISSPSARRAYIRDECVTVCASILEDDRVEPAGSVSELTVDETHPFLTHHLFPSLCAAVEQWIRRESLGADAAEELAAVRRIAVEMMGG